MLFLTFEPDLGNASVGKINILLWRKPPKYIENASIYLSICFFVFQNKYDLLIRNFKNIFTRLEISKEEVVYETRIDNSRV